MRTAYNVFLIQIMIAVKYPLTQIFFLVPEIIIIYHLNFVKDEYILIIYISLRNSVLFILKHS